MSLQDKPEALREKVSFLPDSPGVYTYYDAKGTIIYIGKAKNLRRRVSSYFNREHTVLRTNLLVKAIADMSYIVVPTENDALNLENALIKEHRPRYNVLLKDDKSYPWIAVTNELFPRVFITRHYLRDGSKYFGPYTNTAIAKTIIELIRQIYPLHTCRLQITPEYLKRKSGRLCLQYHIKRCEGCCCGLVEADTYQNYIAHIKKILSGDTAEILQYLRGEMARLAAELKFEEAQALKLRYQLLEKYHAR
ncbi:MAG: GIY-YIG nuclease family protein, partial [Muribaculaceae bacterium]